MPMETPNRFEAMGAVILMPDGTPKLTASSGFASANIAGGTTRAQRLWHRIRRLLRRPSPRQAIIWELRRPLRPDEAFALVTTTPSDVKASAVMGPFGHVTTVTEVGAWPSNIHLAVMRCGGD